MGAAKSRGALAPESGPSSADDDADFRDRRKPGATEQRQESRLQHPGQLQQGSLPGAAALNAGRQRDPLWAFLPHDLRREPPPSGEDAGADAGSGASWTLKRQCAVLLVDVSGFSRLEAHTFAAHPGEPARAAASLAGLLNGFFRVILEAVERSGADVASFAGDALLLVIEAPEGEHPAATAARGVRCAAALFAAGEARARDMRRASTGAPAISLHVGMGFGPVVAVCAGPPGLRRYVCTGPAVEEACCAEPDAETGQLVVSAHAAAYLDRDSHGTVLATGNLLLSPAALAAAVAGGAPRVPPSWDLPGVWRGVDPGAFVPPRIADAFSSGLGEWIDESRPASVVFVAVSGILAERTPGAAVTAAAAVAATTARAAAVTAAVLPRGRRRQSAAFVQVAPDAPTDVDGLALSFHTVLTVFEGVCERFEGIVNKLVVDDKGCIAVLVFGLPPLVHMDDPLRATSAAVAMQRDLTAAGFSASVGVTTGRVFAGVIGDLARRCEYSVIGRTVNLAARLMQHAGSGVLADAATREAAEQGQGVLFEAPTSLALKGFAGETTAFRVRTMGAATSRRLELRPEVAPAPVGRRGELAEVVARLVRGDEGRGAVLVRARAGAGKTTFLRMARERLLRCGFVAFAAAGVPEAGEEPYFAIRDAVAPVLHAWLQPAPEAHGHGSGSGSGLVVGSAGGSQAQEIVARKLALAGGTDAATLAALPLLAAVAPGFPIPPSPATRGMDGESRSRALQRLILLVMRAHVAELAAELRHQARGVQGAVSGGGVGSVRSGRSGHSGRSSGPGHSLRSWPAANGGLKPLLVLDHLDWADGPSLEVVFQAAASRDFAVLAAVRTTEPMPPRLAEACGRFLAAPGASELDLPALGPADAESLALSVLGAHRLGPSAALLLKEQGGGQPLFIVELLQTLRASGMLLWTKAPGGAGGAGGAGEGPPSPEVVAELVDAASADIPTQFSLLVVSRVSLLPFHTQLLLKVAAVVGMRATLSMLVAVYPRQRDGHPAALRALLASAAVKDIGFGRDADWGAGARAAGAAEAGEEAGGYGARGLGLEGAEEEADPLYSWRHQRIQQAVLELCTPEQRLRLHRQIAEYLERLDQEERADERAAAAEAGGSVTSSESGFLRWGDRDAVLAYHWTEAGEKERAVPYGLRHAARAASLFDNTTAAEVLHRCLAALAELQREERGREARGRLREMRRLAHAGLGEALTHRGQLAEALPHLEAAAALGGRPVRRGLAGFLQLQAAMLRMMGHRLREKIVGPGGRGLAGLAGLAALEPPPLSDGPPATSAPAPAAPVAAAAGEEASGKWDAWMAENVPRVEALLAAPPVSGALHGAHREADLTRIGTAFALFETLFFNNEAFPSLSAALHAMNESEAGRVRTHLAVSYSAAAVVFAGLPFSAAHRMHDLFERKALEHAREAIVNFRAKVFAELGFARMLRAEFVRSRLLLDSCKVLCRGIEDGHRLDQIAASAFSLAFFEGDFPRAEREVEGLARSVQGRVWFPAFQILARAAAEGTPRAAGGETLSDVVARLEAAAAGLVDPRAGSAPLVADSEFACGSLALAYDALAAAADPRDPSEAAGARAQAAAWARRSANFARMVPFPCFTVVFLNRLYAVLAALSLVLNNAVPEGETKKSLLGVVEGILSGSRSCRVLQPVVVPLYEFACGLRHLARGAPPPPAASGGAARRAAAASASSTTPAAPSCSSPSSGGPGPGGRRVGAGAGPAPRRRRSAALPRRPRPLARPPPRPA
eukprot:tig00000430_g584.t1